MVSCRRVLSDTLTATCPGRLTPWQELASLKEAETGSAPREMTYDHVGQSLEMLLQMLRLAFRPLVLANVLIHAAGGFALLSRGRSS